MDAAAQAVTATWTFTTGDFTQPEVVDTSPDKGSQVPAPQAVIAYFSEDVSTAEGTFTVTGPKGSVDGALAYYDQVPCDPEAPTCYRLTCQLGTSPPTSRSRRTCTQPRWMV